MISADLRHLAECLEEMMDSDSLTSSFLRETLLRMHEIAEDVHEMEQRPVPPASRVIRFGDGKVLCPQPDYWTGGQS